ncbi:hypothetical protein J7W16_04280 [Bacillus sp. YZJH907-2]|uniref:Uncharacterized protein n=2 Tax=Halalkalibacter suaedae TaxID=2822140 RepID=A0A941ASY6_9BACI|nr:hypothetical protein [Bacillus suaedae]
MVYIRSSDFKRSRDAALQVYKHFHLRSNMIVMVEEKDELGTVIRATKYRILLVTATTLPLRIGVENDIMEYSINFNVQLQYWEGE